MWLMRRLRGWVEGKVVVWLMRRLRRWVEGEVVVWLMRRLRGWVEGEVVVITWLSKGKKERSMGCLKVPSSLLFSQTSASPELLKSNS